MRPISLVLVTSLSIMLCIRSANAQTKTERATVEWGPDQIDSKDGRFDKVVGHNGEHVYMIVNFRSGPFLRKIDREHRTVYLKPLPMKVEKAEHELKQVFVVGEKVLVFTTYVDKKDKSESLYLRIFNDLDLTPIGDMRKLATVDAEKRSTKGYSVVRLSPDRQVLMISRKLAYEKDAPERLHLQVFDRDMNTLWDREVELPHNDENFSVQGMNVADDGTVFLTARMYPDKKVYKELRKDGKLPYTYHLVIVHREEGPPEDHVLDVHGKFLHSLELNFGKEGDILCGGYYGSKGSLDVSGTYFLRLHRATKQISHSSFSEFDRTFITEGMSGKQEAKAEREAAKKGEELGLNDLVLRKIIRRDDGGAVLVGEQFQTYVTTSTSTDQRGFTRIQTTTHYIYNDIIVTSVDPNGDIAWVVRVPKRQASSDDDGRYSSYAVLVKDQYIHLVFNDSGKNLFLKPGEKAESFNFRKDRLVTLVTINAQGTVFREALLAPETREAIILAKNSAQTSDDRLFIYAEWKKEYRFGTVVFK